MLSILSLVSLASLALAAPSTLNTRQATASLSYEPKYDVGSTHLSQVACSDGDFGLLSENFTTYDSLPTFARIGGAPAISGWNDPQCGSCYEITYTSATGASNSIIMTAIDVGSQGFNVGTEAMDQLTGGRAIELGRVDVTYTQVSREQCGLKART